MTGPDIQIDMAVPNVVRAEPVPEPTIDTIQRDRIAPRAPEAASEVAELRDLPSSVARGNRRKITLTIGMATYDDYDGVYFSIQALRLYHPEIADRVEYIVVDNNPDGPCLASLKSLESWIPNYRYIPEPLCVGTSQSRNRVFDEARGDFVLCMDCHVFIAPGALKRLLDYIEHNPRSSDLLQGPLVMDNLKTILTHFKPEWSGGMYGYWDKDPRGIDLDAPPFEIPMQGLGVFVARKDAWLRFHAEFRGFGGEEGYIHEKYRQQGHRTLCLPFLRWLHRFGRPMGVPYPSAWEDRMRNYMIGDRELGLSSDGMKAHFLTLLGAEEANAIFEQLTLFEAA